MKLIRCDRCMAEVLNSEDSHFLVRVSKPLSPVLGWLSLGETVREVQLCPSCTDKLLALWHGAP
jgi:hypothetical protein